MQKDLLVWCASSFHVGMHEWRTCKWRETKYNDRWHGDDYHDMGWLDESFLSTWGLWHGDMKIPQETDNANDPDDSSRA